MDSPNDGIPGYGFCPTNEQLLGHYLAQRIRDHFNGSDPGMNSHLIPDVELYEYDPKELPRVFRNKSGVVPNGKQWFFFCRPVKKYRNSKRSDRTVQNIGYWKVTSTDRTIRDEDTGADLGFKRTLVFYKGRVSKGDKTGWVMHEYHLNPTCVGYKKSDEMPFVICRIKNKDDNDDDDNACNGSTYHRGYSSNLRIQETQVPTSQQEFQGSFLQNHDASSNFADRNYPYQSYAPYDGSYQNGFHYDGGSSSNGGSLYDNYFEQYNKNWNWRAYD